MFPRVTRVTKAGKTYEYLQLIESYRQEGRNRKRVVANLGRLDLLEGKLDGVVSSLRRYCQGNFVLPEEISPRASGVWGPILVARHLWEQMRLREAIGRLASSSRQGFEVAETAFVLVANRLTEPSSEHGLARWLEHTYVCDHSGRRWQPQWLPPQAVTCGQRVKVNHSQLYPWYRTLDLLLEAKEQIEGALYMRVRDLFSLKVDLVFYDVTSTFFRRPQPAGRLRRHGHWRDGHPREVQVVVGVVMANGWPIAHHVFGGNTADRATLESVVAHVERRFALGRVMVVADRGMVSPQNLEFLCGRGFRFLLGIQGRRNAEAARVLAALHQEEKAWGVVDDDNRVQEVDLGEGEVRYFVVQSRVRKHYEESLRHKWVDRVRQALQRIERAVKDRRLKDPAKIGARAARAMANSHGLRYFSYQVAGEGRFSFEEDPVKMQAELAREGTYILKSNDPHITPIDAVEAYKELSTVEAGFRDLKDIIDMRPVWHRTEERVRAHIFVATLALFLKRTLKHQLERQGVYLSATEALAAMKSMSVTELNLNGRKDLVVSTPGPDARRVLKALGIRDIHPPACGGAPAKRQQTTMW